MLTYEGWLPDEEPHREALTTLGNGCFATRGAAEEAGAGGPSYPGTYLAGGYDRLASRVGDRVVENEDLVNWPSWLALTFRIEGGPWLDLQRVRVLSYELSLNLRAGVLVRTVRFTDPTGRSSLLESRRIVHMADSHVAALQWTLTALDWSGSVEICSAIDGRVENAGVARYRALEGRHIEVVERDRVGEDAVVLVSRTRQSHIVMAQAIRTRAFCAGHLAVLDRTTRTEADWMGQHLHLSCEMQEPIRIEKVLALHTSRDAASSEPKLEASERVQRLGDFDALARTHELAWASLWRRADLVVEGAEPSLQLVLRLHVFHLLQVASIHTIDRDVGIPARGLHGEAYRGHVFWDELFIFPFLTLRIPELVRSLSMYRYRRLPEARHAARLAGYAGAMFPWQSGSNGREESQVVHLNPRSQRWVPDETHLQRHVNVAVAYNVWRYFEATADLQFLSFYGAELILELAHFWASIATYDASRGRYVIVGVVGPDEFHTRYPGRDEPGIDNNAYTNVMAAWTLRIARQALDRLPRERAAELLALLEIDDDDLFRWQDICRKMYVPFHDDGVISQFDGWNDLDELDWQAARAEHGDIKRLDRLLEAAGDDVNRYKASKQADVLMLFFVLSAEEIRSLLADMGYRLDPDAIRRTIAHYQARTSHGSTLSAVRGVGRPAGPVARRVPEGRPQGLPRGPLAHGGHDAARGLPRAHDADAPDERRALAARRSPRSACARS